MDSTFHQAPAAYRSETTRISRAWWVLLPILTPLALGLYAFFDPESYRTYLQDETGALEFLHAVLPVAAAGIAARLLFMEEVRRDKLVATWLVLFVIGGLYLGGEEASWGQHYFGWTTPEEWAALNRQQETNLHNTSFLFDRLPRVAMTLAIIVGGLVLPFLKLRGSRLIPARLDILIPPLSLTVLTGVFVGGEILGGLALQFPAVDEMIRFRPGEMQENFIIAFIFLYMIVLQQRASAFRASEQRERSAHDARPEPARMYPAPGE